MWSRQIVKKHLSVALDISVDPGVGALFLWERSKGQLDITVFAGRGKRLYIGFLLFGPLRNAYERGYVQGFDSGWGAHKRFGNRMRRES